MGSVIRFIGWVLGQAWKYGAAGVRYIANWARTHWTTVEVWINRGMTYPAIAEMIWRLLQ